MKQISFMTFFLASFLLLSACTRPKSADSASTDDSETSKFISSWKTDNVGLSTSTQIALPLEPTGTYNFQVNWGDGTTDTITTWNQAEATHTYSAVGTYSVEIIGVIVGFRFNGGLDSRKLMNISSFGPLHLGNSGNYFLGAENLTITAMDSLKLAPDSIDSVGTTNLAYAFSGTAVSTIPSINNWDTSHVTDMTSLFLHTSFNDDISNWDVSSVTTMESMFAYSLFNSNIGNWDVSHVTNMNQMFYDSTFNQNISSWNVSNVTDMFAMFASTPFNQNIGGWDVSHVMEMRYMLYSTPFNQSLAGWSPTALTHADHFLESAALSTANYDATLNAWAALSLQSGVTIHFGSTPYTSAVSGAAVTTLTTTFSWTITDGGGI